MYGIDDLIYAFRYNVDDLKIEGNTKILSNVKIIYVEGFFLSHSPEVVEELSMLCDQKDKILILNLCGEYVCKNEEYCKNVLKLLPSIKFIFGNRSELQMFLETVAKINDTTDEEKQVTRNLQESLSSEISESSNNNVDIDKEAQYVVVTDGHNPVCCYSIRYKNLRFISFQYEQYMISHVMMIY